MVCEAEHLYQDGADQQPLRPVLVEVFGLGQRDGVRGAVDGLGQLLLPLLHPTAEPENHIMGDGLSVDGDRAELCPINPWLHGPLTALAPSRASTLSANESHGPVRPSQPTPIAKQAGR